MVDVLIVIIELSIVISLVNAGIKKWVDHTDKDEDNPKE